MRSANGAISHDTKQGTYIVNPDCTGTLDLFVTNQAGVVARHSVWSFVIADKEQELRSIMTSMVALPSGTPLAPIADDERAGSCSPAARTDRTSSGVDQKQKAGWAGNCSG
ncbi:MAG: hypothetical protein MZW92_42420 [Comamonadaceae bacterium]|nr:hypothetical protein [Comamonadaceae bacterium]